MKCLRMATIGEGTENLKFEISKGTKQFGWAALLQSATIQKLFTDGHVCRVLAMSLLTELGICLGRVSTEMSCLTALMPAARCGKVRQDDPDLRRRRGGAEDFWCAG